MNENETIDKEANAGVPPPAPIETLTEAVPDLRREIDLLKEDISKLQQDTGILRSDLDHIIGHVRAAGESLAKMLGEPFRGLLAKLHL